MVLGIRRDYLSEVLLSFCVNMWVLRIPSPIIASSLSCSPLSIPIVCIPVSNRQSIVRRLLHSMGIFIAVVQQISCCFVSSYFQGFSIGTRSTVKVTSRRISCAPWSKPLEPIDEALSCEISAFDGPRSSSCSDVVTIDLLIGYVSRSKS